MILHISFLTSLISKVFSYEFAHRTVSVVLKRETV